MKKNKVDIIRLITEKSEINSDESFLFAKKVSTLILSDDPEELEYGRQIVIHVLDKWEKFPPSSQEIWGDLIEACGYYPYLKKEEIKIKLKNFSGLIRKELHKSNHLHGKYLHEEQQYLLKLFDSGKNLIVSAPTSFGKSLLIEELVAKKNFKNIVIIQPTLALLDETRKNLKKYKDSYKIIIKTTQKYSEGSNNIFLLTAERVMEYPEFPQIDLIIIDEFYKLSSSRKDERADNLNIAFYKILKKFKPRFYLLGPNIDGISKNFAEEYNAEFYKTNYSMVTADFVDVYKQHKSKLSHPRKYATFRKNLLFKKLTELSDEQTIIYCSSPDHTRDLARGFLDYLVNNVPDKIQLKSSPLIEWIKENISSNWSLVKCLTAGIGVHDAALPRHISSSIIHQFNRSEIKYLFCTSTIIEGVNTSAKNVIIFDPKKGRGPLDYFDYSNIGGRAGRLMVHYVGRIFSFISQPKKENVIIDLPFYDQLGDTTEEVFIQLDKEDIKDSNNENYKSVESLPEDQKILFKKNGVSVDGQKSILEKMLVGLDSNPGIITWNRFPSRSQILYIITLCWEHFKKPSESMGFSLSKVATLLGKYANQPEIMKLVAEEYAWMLREHPESDRQDLLDNTVKKLFQFQRHWLEYTLPKWFHVVNSLQQFACEKKGIKPGDYTYYASSLENDFVKPNLTFLLEIGIPRSAVKKIEQYVDDELEESQVILLIKSNIESFGLTEYEIERLRELD